MYTGGFSEIDHLSDYPVYFSEKIVTLSDKYLLFRKMYTFLRKDYTFRKKVYTLSKNIFSANFLLRFCCKLVARGLHKTQELLKPINLNPGLLLLCT